MIKRSYWMKGFIAIGIIAILYLVGAACSSVYYPIINAPLTQIYSILLGIAACLLRNSCKSLRFHQFWGIYLIFMGVFTSFALNMCDIYMWCMLWIVAGINILAEVRQSKKIMSNDKWNELKTISQNINSILPEMETTQRECPQDIASGNITKQLRRNKVQNCCFFVNAFLMTLFAVVSAITCYYHLFYPAIGKMITIKLDNQKQSVKFHTFCSQLSQSKYPTLIIQHPRGGNMIGYLPLLEQLRSKGIRTCIFDQLGYGRSSKSVPNLSPESKVKLTHKMIDELVSENDMIVYAGWNDAAQLAQIYAHYYPEKVRALIFMDGHPELKKIKEIYNLQTESVIQKLIKQGLQLFEPFGVDMLYGENNILNREIHNQYIAYYRTGYLLDSLATDQKYYSNTQWLTKLAHKKPSTKHYSQKLTWPQIYVPLLVLSSKEMLQHQYYQNLVRFYLQKCESQTKTMIEIDSNDQFPLERPKIVAQHIFNFFLKL